MALSFTGEQPELRAVVRKFRGGSFLRSAGPHAVAHPYNLIRNPE